jgi:ribosome-associated protein
VALTAAQAAADKLADDIRILDIGDLLAITDYFVLVSARNDLMLKTVIENVEREIKERYGRGPKRREGTPATGWMILDYGDVVLHGFTAEQRDFYQLERLWSDAPVLPFVDAAIAEASGE